MSREPPTAPLLFFVLIFSSFSHAYFSLFSSLSYPIFILYFFNQQFASFITFLFHVPCESFLMHLCIFNLHFTLVYYCLFLMVCLSSYFNQIYYTFSFFCRNFILCNSPLIVSRSAMLLSYNIVNKEPPSTNVSVLTARPLITLPIIHQTLICVLLNTGTLVFLQHIN
jgi:hypothetical protein